MVVMLVRFSLEILKINFRKTRGKSQLFYIICTVFLYRHQSRRASCRAVTIIFSVRNREMIPTLRDPRRETPKCVLGLAYEVQPHLHAVRAAVVQVDLEPVVLAGAFPLHGVRP